VRGLVLLNPTHPHIGDKHYTPAAQREAWYQHFHLLPLAGQLIDGDRRRVEQYLAHFYTHWAGDTRIDPGELSVVADTYARPGAFTSSIACAGPPTAALPPWTAGATSSSAGPVP
jgi:hypothetical protein